MKQELHPRNRHRGLYDFKQLTESCPDLAPFVGNNKYGNESIDFTDPRAVKALNKALLKSFYNIIWDIPESFLCPPIPSRADYIHSIADLLYRNNLKNQNFEVKPTPLKTDSSSCFGISPTGKKITILDIGVGANCIYPLIGHREYGWRFIGTDIDPVAISIADGIIMQNGLQDSIEIRLQKSPTNIFEGVVEDCIFDISMCNPPFHTSQSDANAGTKRKWKNLHKKTSLLNFGGKSNELWCPGGEVAFIKQMIKESVHVNCKWFTSLVSKEANLPFIYRDLEKVQASEVRTINLGQGQKQSRIVAWKF